MNSIIVWQIDPLPDFLNDHTLTGSEMHSRLREYASRWVQLIGSLWEWYDRATFALRYVARDGGIGIYLMARARNPSETKRLEGELGVILRAHRLGEGSTATRLPWIEFINKTTLPAMATVEVRQHQTRSLWELPRAVATRFESQSEWSWVPKEDWSSSPLIYPWWGPGGPFLLPMESLVSQPVAVSLSIYLEPTVLSAHERAWLSLMSREAQSKAETTIQPLSTGASVRITDPPAKLAGRLYMENLRRLSAAPFLVTVHCAAAEDRKDVALSVAGSIQALVHEPAFERPLQEDDRLPSGTTVRLSDGAGDKQMQAAIDKQYQELAFEQLAAKQSLQRLPLLADAQGAATVFRLPVSVRGGVPGVRVHQLPPDFHPGAREEHCPPRHIELGTYHAGGGAFLPVDDLTKHALITGFTGTGKTVTVLQILHQLWIDHDIPFLVLESAKQEYRGLLGVEAFQQEGKRLHIYTLGNETCVPFRLNPFELLPGVRVEAHLAKLQTCFEAAIPPIGPSSSVIAEALHVVYANAGWNLTDTQPLNESSRRKFPTLSVFVSTLQQVLENRGYSGELKDNLTAALVGRFRPLLLGSRGRMFDAQRSNPSPGELFSKSTVLEMNDLMLEDKALLVLFLLTMLREHRERQGAGGGVLKHLTLVEEAHNVLEETKSEGSGEGATKADTRYKAVQAFCSLLTEIRALGEGLMIADQSPEKLARDAIRNTNLQIAHQLRDSHDRDAMANAMIMEREQRDYLGKLPPGRAALFRTGLEKATFIQVKKYYPIQTDFQRAPRDHTSPQWLDWKGAFRGFGYIPSVSDEEVAKYMCKLLPDQQIGRLDLPYAGCEFCASKCRFRDAVFPSFDEREALEEALQWFKLTEKAFREEQGLSTDDVWDQVVRLSLDATLDQGLQRSVDSSWCYFVHLWQKASEVNGLDPAIEGLDLECRQLFERHYARIGKAEV